MIDPVILSLIISCFAAEVQSHEPDILYAIKALRKKIVACVVQSEGELKDMIKRIKKWHYKKN